MVVPLGPFSYTAVLAQEIFYTENNPFRRFIYRETGVTHDHTSPGTDRGPAVIALDQERGQDREQNPVGPWLL